MCGRMYSSTRVCAVAVRDEAGDETRGVLRKISIAHSAVMSGSL